jgi:hypothetical protein
MRIGVIFVGRWPALAGFGVATQGYLADLRHFPHIRFATCQPCAMRFSLKQTF